MYMRNQNKRNKKKRCHWFEFEVVYETGIYTESYEIDVFDVRLFVESAREGIHFISKSFPNCWVVYEERMDIKRRKAKKIRR